MQFFKPEFFIYLWLVPAVFGIFILSRKFWKTKLHRLIRDRALLHRLLEGYRPAEWMRRTLLITGAVLMMVLALARPQWGDEKRSVQRKGVDLIFLVDTSLSMLAEDIKPNRLEKAKFEIKTFVQTLGGDRIGMITFAGSGFLQSPLTLDHAAFLLFLDAVQVGFLPDPGTSLAQAIRLAIRAFPQKDLKYKALVLFTDGEDHEGGIDKVLEEAKQAGVRIYTLGLGTTEGEPIPLKNERGERSGFKKDRGGQMVLTRLNQPLLEKIARETGGIYLPATPGEKEVELIQKHLKSWGEQKFSEKMVVEKEDQYQIFLVLALALLLAEMLARRRNRPSIGKAAQVLGCLAVFFLFTGFFETSQGLVKKGNENYANKKYQSALESYRRVQVKNPDNPEVLYDLGTTLYKTDGFQESAQDLEAAVQKAKDPALLAKALYNYGNAQYRLGAFEKAIEAYKKALEIDPGDKDAKFNLEFLQKQKKSRDKKDQERQNEKQKKENQQPKQSQQQKDQQNQGQQQQQQQQSQGQGQQDPQQSEQEKQEQQQQQQAQKEQQEQQKQQQSQQQQDQQDKQDQQQQSSQQDQQKSQEEKEKEERERQQEQKEQEERERQEQERQKQEKLTQAKEQQQGQPKQPLQGQMSMENALNILDALKESEKELQDLRRPPVNRNPPPVEKDW